MIYRGMIKKTKNGNKRWSYGRYWYFLEVHDHWVGLQSIKKQCNYAEMFGQEYRDWHLQLADDVCLWGNTDPFIFHFRYKKDLLLFKAMTSR
jgi:hypothetical protein